jgi:hypothetical protein
MESDDQKYRIEISELISALDITVNIVAPANQVIIIDQSVG